MKEDSKISNEFIDQLNGIIEDHFENESYGVSQLAGDMGMSRSNLHRKVKQFTGETVTQYLRHYRLKKAMDLLQGSEVSVSEVSFKTGFSSPSYFVKCFRDYYGYSPGKVGTEPPQKQNLLSSFFNKIKSGKIMMAAALFVILTTVVVLIITNVFSKPEIADNKTLAVLPVEDFNSGDSNLNIADGLLVEIIDQLSEIDSLKVIPYSTIKHYKNSPKSDREIASELMVSYLLQGNIQKFGNVIKLRFELIDGKTEEAIWKSPAFTRNIDESEIEKIFDFQEDIAFSIASRLQIRLSPEDENQITELPTDIPAAYQKYQEANNYMQVNSLSEAITLLKDAILLDSTYSSALALLGKIYIEKLYPQTNIYTAQKYLDTGYVYINKALKYDENNREALYQIRNYYVLRGMPEKALSTWKSFNKDIKNHYYYEQEILFYNQLTDYYNTIKSFYRYKNLLPKNELIPEHIYLAMINTFAGIGFPETANKYAAELLHHNNDSSRYYANLLRIGKRTGDCNTVLKYADKLNLSDNENEMWMVAHCLILLEEYEKGYKLIEQLQDIADNSYLNAKAPFLLASYSQQKMPDSPEAQKRTDEAVTFYNDQLRFKTPEAQQYFSHYYLMILYLQVDAPALALKYFQELENKDVLPHWMILDIKNYPAFQTLRNLPEYNETILTLETKFYNEKSRVEELLAEFDATAQI